MRPNLFSILVFVSVQFAPVFAFGQDFERTDGVERVEINSGEAERYIYIRADSPAENAEALEGLSEELAGAKDLEVGFATGSPAFDVEDRTRIYNGKFEWFLITFRTAGIATLVFYQYHLEYGDAKTALQIAIPTALATLMSAASQYFFDYEVDWVGLRSDRKNWRDIRGLFRFARDEAGRRIQSSIVGAGSKEFLYGLVYILVVRASEVAAGLNPVGFSKDWLGLRLPDSIYQPLAALSETPLGMMAVVPFLYAIIAWTTDGAMNYLNPYVTLKLARVFPEREALIRRLSKVAKVVASISLTTLYLNAMQGNEWSNNVLLAVALGTGATVASIFSWDKIKRATNVVELSKGVCRKVFSRVRRGPD